MRTMGTVFAEIVIAFAAREGSLLANDMYHSNIPSFSARYSRVESPVDGLPTSITRVLRYNQDLLQFLDKVRWSKALRE